MTNEPASGVQSHRWDITPLMSIHFSWRECLGFKPRLWRNQDEKLEVRKIWSGLKPTRGGGLTVEIIHTTWRGMGAIIMKIINRDDNLHQIANLLAAYHSILKSLPVARDRTVLGGKKFVKRHLRVLKMKFQLFLACIFVPRQKRCFPGMLFLLLFKPW